MPCSRRVSSSTITTVDGPSPHLAAVGVAADAAVGGDSGLVAVEVVAAVVAVAAVASVAPLAIDVDAVEVVEVDEEAADGDAQFSN